MKKLPLYLFGLILFSCGESEKSESEAENVLENLEISIDTMVVDVGEEIFNPGMYYQFGLSQDGRSIFFALNQEPEVHQIDLRDLKLTKRIYFEKDGPNRAPDFINYFEVLPEDEFMLANYAIQGVYNQSGEQTKVMKLQASEFEGIDETLGSLYASLAINLDKSKAFSLPSIFGSIAEGLAVLDLENKTGEILPLPALDLTQNFQVTFAQNGGMTTSGDMIRMQKIQDQLFIHSGSTADVYVYNIKSDSLRLISFNHQMVEKNKTGEFKKEVDSHKERMEVSSQMRRQITFYEFYWDESRKQYFRFGAKENGTRETGEPLPADVYIFVYDQDLRLLGEQKVDIPYPPSKAFFYSGKLYAYTVVGEDPGFVTYNLKF